MEVTISLSPRLPLIISHATEPIIQIVLRVGVS